MRTTARALALTLALTLAAACERAEPDRTTARRTDSLAVVDSASSAGIDTTTSSSARIDAGSTAASATADSLRAALERLTAGTIESTWFSGETSDVLRSVAVDANGHAVIDFVDLRDHIPNASSSAGSLALLDELNAAVFSVDGVESVEYRMNGDCELLGEWLQYGVCLTFDRTR